MTKTVKSIDQLDQTLKLADFISLGIVKGEERGMAGSGTWDFVAMAVDHNKLGALLAGKLGMELTGIETDGGVKTVLTFK